MNQLGGCGYCLRVMTAESSASIEVDRDITRLFGLVSDALERATDALLRGRVAIGQGVVDSDHQIDELTRTLSRFVWEQIDSSSSNIDDLRHWVAVLMILPELERSADLAEHIARRAVQDVGLEMSSACQGYIQRMSEVALEMWEAVGVAFADRSAQGVMVDEADEEIDILHDRLTQEVAAGTMPANVVGDVILLGRFYERFGDHAVNLARRIGTLPGARESARDETPLPKRCAWSGIVGRNG